MRDRDTITTSERWRRQAGGVAEGKERGEWKRICWAALLIAGIICGAAGCQVGQPTLSVTAGNAGAAFVAASTTLSYLHMGKISRAYAQASFESYKGELNGLDAQLSQQQGSADRQTIAQLIEASKPALQAVERPCLNTACDWRAQVAALDHASQTFLKAGGQ